MNIWWLVATILLQFTDSSQWKSNSLLLCSTYRMPHPEPVAQNIISFSNNTILNNYHKKLNYYKFIMIIIQRIIPYVDAAKGAAIIRNTVCTN